MKSRFFIYTANHGKQAGIEDYVTLLKNIFGSRGHRIETSSSLHKNATHIIIDEFTNSLENKRITSFRKNNPNSRFIFILTEFWARKFGVESLNHFGGLNDSAIIALSNVYLRMKRDDFPPLRISDVATLLLHSPVLAAHFAISLTRYFVLKLIGISAGGPFSDFLRRYHRLIYFHMRYLGLATHLSYADAVIASHEQILPSLSRLSDVARIKLKYLGVLYPEFDEQEVLKRLMKNKKPYVEITGSITSYRKKWIDRLDRSLMQLGLINSFGYCRAIPFSLSSDMSSKSGAYSLHPPQVRKWPYCSPTRIYRALAVDHNLPVLTKHFSQNPIEDVCFLLTNQHSVIDMVNMYYDKKALSNFIKPKIKNYNEIAKRRNDHVVEAFLRICS